MDQDVKRQIPLSPRSPDLRYLFADNSSRLPKLSIGAKKASTLSTTFLLKASLKAFKITIPIRGYAVKFRVVLPKSHIEEIKHLSNYIFSWQLASRIIFAQDYTSGPDRGQLSGKALQVGIHQNLGDITKQLNERIFDYFSAHLPQQKGNVETVNLVEFFIPTITYVTNALLVDKSLSSDPTGSKRRPTSPSAATAVASLPRLNRRPNDPLRAPPAQPASSTRTTRKAGRGRPGLPVTVGGAPDDVTLRDFSDTMMRTVIAAIHMTAKTVGPMPGYHPDPNNPKHVSWVTV
ncbi:hypothetical protein BKA56DRAFT_716533 [Ilyonectria sp. MPI-CAGE-AT-0026]|nr:hypothetical protein BKA56DRAFT_716533 [Ilyonectria sp. MPI-CAGE-AT-0026]